MKTDPRIIKPPPTNDPTAVPEWDQATLELAADAARGYYELGMIDEAEAAMRLPPGAPEHWRSFMEAGLARLIWARGDMQSFVRICYPWRHERALPWEWYRMVSIALMNLGRIPEAVELTQEGMNQNGARSGDYYHLACFFTNAGHYTKALDALIAGLSCPCFDRFKALVDSDLQPLWYRLPGLIAGLHRRAAAGIPSLIGLGDFLLQPPEETVWDPPDRAKLPAAFGLRLVFSPGRGLFIMDPQAPDRVKRNFKCWSTSRARAAQRLIRRTVQKSPDH